MADDMKLSVEGERDRHSEVQPARAASEQTRKIAVVCVAAVCAAGLISVQWSVKPVKTAPRTQIRQSVVLEKPMEKAPIRLLHADAAPRLAPLEEGEAPPPEMRPAPVDPMLESARRAPVLAVNKREVRQSGETATAIPGVQEIEADDKGAFEKRLKPPRLDRVRAGMLGDLNLVVPQGTSIPCTLETAMQSDQPGFVTCVVPRDVLGANGRVVLLERGTQVVGEYRGGLRQGQVRLHVLWSRARTPGGVVIELASPATDALGRSGTGGTVDNHWFERFGSALLLSVVSDAAKVAIKAAQASTGESLANTGQAGQQAAAIAVEQSINMPPTLHKHQGEHVAIMVARDLDFSDVYALRSVKNRGADEWQSHVNLSGGSHGRSLKD